MRGPVLLHEKPASLPAGVNLNAVQRWVHEGQGGREEKGEGCATGALHKTQGSANRTSTTRAPTLSCSARGSGHHSQTHRWPCDTGNCPHLCSHLSPHLLLLGLWYRYGHVTPSDILLAHHMHQGCEPRLPGTMSDGGMLPKQFL